MSSYFSIVTGPLVNIISSAYTNYASTEINQPHPGSVIVTLAEIKLLPTKTKIHFLNCKMKYLLPDFFTQSKERTLKAKECKELSNLKFPILQALEYYNLQNSKVNFLFTQAYGGLKQLQKTYVLENEPTRADALEYYAFLIKNKLDSVDKSYVSESDPILNPALKNSEETKQRDDVLNVYPKEKIIEFANWIEKAAKTQGNENSDTKILCQKEISKIDSLLEEKDNEYIDVINSFTTEWAKKK